MRILLIVFLIIFLNSHTSYATEDASTLALDKIKALRNSGHVNEAITVSLHHLQQFPKDVDVMLLLGLLYYQQQNFDNALKYLTLVLQKSPAYLDAKIALTRVYVAKKQFARANHLLQQMKKQAPDDKRVLEVQNFYTKAKNAEEIATIQRYYKAGQYAQAEFLSLNYLEQHADNIDIHLLLANSYFKQKKYLLARCEFASLLSRSPNNTNAILGLIDIALDIKDDRCAFCLIDRALWTQSCNNQYWMRLIKLYELQHKPAIAAEYDKKILRKNPEDQDAKNDLKALTDINPFLTRGVNEIGIYTLNDYVNDLKTIWDYSSLYYRRDTPYGYFNAQINYASRYGFRNIEEEVDLVPTFNQYLSINFVAKHSNEPVLFPTYTVGAEPSVVIPTFMNISAGGLHAHIVKKTFYNRYTLSFNRDIGQYWINYRPYCFVPNRGRSSILNTLTIRRYLGTTDCYVNLMMGIGKSPDLSDLETLNFIVINNTFASLSVRFPIVNHSFLVDLGVEYLHWGYPTGLVRELFGASMALAYRF